MLKKYALKMGIGIKKITLFTKEKEYSEGRLIEGGIKFLGGYIPQKIRRYDIDLIAYDHKSAQQEIVRSHSVFCSISIKPHEQIETPFFLEIPPAKELNMKDHQYYIKANFMLDYQVEKSVKVPVTIH